MPSVFAGRIPEEAIPKTAIGRAIPNATFQLYIIGTKTSPTYYSDREKSEVVPGDPQTDSFGNVNGFCEPGDYEFWYNGRQYGEVTVIEANEEDDAAIEALRSEILDLLASYPTTEEMETAISAGGGPTVGAELLANKGQANGYAGLGADSKVPNAQLPTTATTSTRNPTTHGAQHLPGGSDPITSPGPLIGTHFVAPDTGETYDADFGDFVVPSGEVATIVLPAPQADKPPITVLPPLGDEFPSINVSGDFGDGDETRVVGVYGGDYHAYSATFTAIDDKWFNIGVSPSGLSLFDSFTLSGKKLPISNPVPIEYMEDVAFGTGSSMVTFVHVDPDPFDALLDNTAAQGTVVSWIRRAGAGQIHFVPVSGASIEEADGNEYSGPEKSRCTGVVIENSDGLSAVWFFDGYMGEVEA